MTIYPEINVPDDDNKAKCSSMLLGCEEQPNHVIFTQPDENIQDVTNNPDILKTIFQFFFLRESADDGVYCKYKEEAL